MYSDLRGSMQRDAIKFFTQESGGYAWKITKESTLVWFLKKSKTIKVKLKF